MKRVIYLVPAFVWICIITFLSLMSTKSLTKLNVDIMSLDKLAHIFIYTVLTFFIAWGLKKSLKYNNLSLKLLSIIFLVSSFYGIGMEIAQKTLSTGRHFEYYDIIANIIGSFIGILFFIRKKK